MKYNTIFWDWNGTIIDDLEIAVECINSLFLSRGMKQFDNINDYHNVFCFPIIKYYEKAGFDYNIEPYEKLADEYILNYNEKSKNAIVFEDILKLIDILQKENVRQIILSASEREKLILWLKEVNIYKYFDDVIGLDNVYAKGKVDIALKWLNNNNVDLKKALMIGDTTHDAEVAKAMGCDCVLISRGHNSYEKLIKSNCKIFKNAEELHNFLK